MAAKLGDTEGVRRERGRVYEKGKSRWKGWRLMRFYLSRESYTNAQAELQIGKM